MRISVLVSDVCSTDLPGRRTASASRVPSARCLGRRSWAWTIGGSFLRAPPTREPCFVLAAEPPLSLVGAYLGPLVVFTARHVIDALAVGTDVALDDAAAFLSSHLGRYPLRSEARRGG